MSGVLSKSVFSSVNQETVSPNWACTHNQSYEEEKEREGVGQRDYIVLEKRASDSSRDALAFALEPGR